jgi:hypothetical protein
LYTKTVKINILIVYEFPVDLKLSGKALSKLQQKPKFHYPIRCNIIAADIKISFYLTSDDMSARYYFRRNFYCGAPGAYLPHLTLFF